MQILPLNPEAPEAAVIAEAVAALRRGGIIAYPSDTCYGLGGDARNAHVLERITALKGGREATKRYSVIARNLRHIESLTVLSPDQRAILAHYLPGPYTFIVVNADFAVSQTSTLGIRWPDYPVTQLLADAFNDAYVTTSANLSGRELIYDVESLQRDLLDHVDKSLWPDVVLDAGTLLPRPSSTVVDLTGDEPRILRPGAGTFQWPITVAQ